MGEPTKDVCEAVVRPLWKEIALTPSPLVRCPDGSNSQTAGRLTSTVSTKGIGKGVDSRTQVANVAGSISLSVKMKVQCLC